MRVSDTEKRLVRRRRLACGAALCACLAAAPALAGSLRIWPTATVSGPDVRLGDVARFDGVDAALAARLAALVVAPAPAAGAESGVTLDELRSCLAGAGVNMAELTLIGAARCRIRSLPPSGDRDRRGAAPPAGARAARDAGRKRPDAVSGNTGGGNTAGAARSAAAGASRFTPASAAEPASAAACAPDSLEAAIRARIAADGRALGGRFEVRFGAAHQAALRIRSTDCRFQVRPRDPLGDRLGMVWYDADVARAAGGAQTISILADVTLLKPVVVAARIINSGQEIAAHDVRVEERPFKRVEDVGLTDPSSAIGMEARRALRPGDMLRARDAQARALVRRNQLVTVWSRAGGLVIQSSGRAVRDGWLGDEIEVRAEGSEERFSGVVIGPAMVSIGGPARTAEAVARR